MADSQNLFVLVETAGGYSLFEVVQNEEIASFLDQNAADAITDLQRFSRSVKLKSFQPFESAQDALENCTAISEHAMTSGLQSFLEMNLPIINNNKSDVDSNKKKKKKKSSLSSSTTSFSLGVIDPALATAISTALPTLTCRSDDTIREISRGCHLHLSHFLSSGITSTTTQHPSSTIRAAQLGLGHGYSRLKVKFNPARSDNMIIQSVSLLDQMDKDLNSFTMRVREWYSWHFPELKDLVKDSYMYARCASFIKDRTSLFRKTNVKKDDDDNEEEEEEDEEEEGDDTTEMKKKGLLEITGDEQMVESIIHAAKSSTGMDCSEVDMLNMTNFTERLVRLSEYRLRLSQYLHDKMDLVAPNLSALIGDTVAARLISKAGSLTNLAKAPASTVQILGAEKALFRALKTKGNTPKYGLIYNSTFIGRADAKNKGRISRYLANKCSIATRIDSFSDVPSRLYGEQLRDQVEERLKFYQTGASPRKNVDVMMEVAKRLKAEKGEEEGKDVAMEDVEEGDKKKKKKDKKDKKKKRKAEEDMVIDDDDQGKKEKTPKKSAKKAKKEADAVETPKKEGGEEIEDTTPSTDKSKKSSKKKKKDKKSDKKKRRKSKD